MSSRLDVRRSWFGLAAVLTLVCSVSGQALDGARSAGWTWSGTTRRRIVRLQNQRDHARLTRGVAANR